MIQLTEDFEIQITYFRHFSPSLKVPSHPCLKSQLQNGVIFREYWRQNNFVCDVFEKLKFTCLPIYIIKTSD